MDLAIVFESAVNGDRQSIILLASAYAFLVCTYSAIYQMRINAWPSVQGMLIEYGISKFGQQSATRSEQHYVAKASYQYAVDGKQYTSTRVSPWIVIASSNARWILAKQLAQVAVNTEQAVAVFYNPKKPDKSYLIKPGIVSQLVTFAIGVTPAVFYLFEYNA